MRIILSLFLIALAQVFLSAETKAQTASCPAIEIRSQEGNKFRRLLPGFTSEVTLTANVTDVSAKDKPIFNWRVSSGKIISGQGTSAVTIAPGEEIGEIITVTVEVSGVSALTPECDNRAFMEIGFREPSCPNISVSCPTDTTDPSAPVEFSVNISGGGPDLNLKYNWQVSPGRIIDGQGTLKITVDTKGTEGQHVTATVEIDGLPPECDKTESCSVSFSFDPPTARKFDEYDEISWISEEARFVNFGIQLKKEPEARGFVIIYGAGGHVKQHLARTRKFLVEKQDINPNRIRLINGGYNKKSKVELWIVPTGATPPTANPNF